jgi:hypothetical protein
VHQICPISPYLFVITAEILDIVIRHSDDINGFKYKNAEYKLSQYAYEIQIIIDGSEKTPLKLLLIYLMKIFFLIFASLSSQKKY